MWSSGALRAFSRSAIRAISSGRYVAAAEECDALQVTDTKRLYAVVKAARNDGTPIQDALENVNGRFTMSQVEKSVIGGSPETVQPIYSWAKAKEGFCYTRKFVVALMSALRKTEQLDQASEVVSDMTGKAEPHIESLARSLLYVAYVRAGDAENAEKAKAELQERGFKMEPFAMTHLINLTHESDGLIAMLEVYKEHFEQGILPDANGLNLVVARLCFARKVDDAYQVFKETGAKGVEHTAATFITLVGALLKFNRVDDAQEVAEMLFEIGCPSNFLNSLKQLIKRRADQKRYDDMMKLLKPLAEQDQRLGSLSLMRYLVDDKEWDKAMEVVELMKKLKVKCDLQYSLLVKGLCKEKRAEDARKVFDAMVEMGLAPDADTCLTIALYGK